MSPRFFALPILFTVACGAKVAIDADPIAGTGGAGGATTTTSTTTTTTTTSTTTTSATTTSTTGGPVDAGPPPVAVYANSGAALFLLDPVTQAVSVVGDFKGCDKVVDLAVDATGRIFATTPAGLFRVDPGDATCTLIGGGGVEYPNSLSFVPAGTVDPAVEALVGFRDAAYVRIDETTGAVTPIGALAADFTSSGDLVTLPDGRTYLTVKGGGCNDCIAQVDPKTGNIIEAVGKIGTPDVWGLAYWGGVAYGFTKAGGVLQIDLSSGVGAPLAWPGFPFWGAGSSTAAAP